MLTSTSTNPPERCDEDLLQEASRWTALISRRAPTSRERDELAMWLDGDARRAAALELAMDAWNKAPEMLKGLGYHQPRGDRERRVGQAWWGSTPRRAAFALATVCILVFAFLWRGSVGEPELYRAEQVQQALVLADGSRITLEPGSEMAVDFTGPTRSVRLSAGHAEFDVVKSTRPFVVDADDLRVEVLGTAFSVDMSGDQTDVQLHRGKIALKRGTHRLAELHPGDRATFRRDRQRLELIRSDQPPGAAGASSMLPPGNTGLVASADGVTANSERLDRVAALLERKTGRRLRLANAQIGETRLTGHIGLDNFEIDLQRALQPHDLMVVEQADGLLLVPKAPTRSGS